MKTLFVLACIAFVAHAVDPEIIEKFKARVMKYAGECKTETGANEDDFKPIMSRDAPTTPKGKCFLACMFEKLEYIDAEGKLNIPGKDAALEKIKAADENLYVKMKQIVESCYETVKETGDKCETAVELFKCVEGGKQAAGLNVMDLKF